MWLYVSFQAQDVINKEISLPLTESEIESLLSNTFHDNALISENITIEIVNGTGIPGLAGKMEKVVSRMGGNVIAVSNAQSDESTSQIHYYEDEEGKYARERFGKLFSFPLVQTNQKALSDIIIIIGKDNIPKIVQ
jgi:polyisoprenyl-teichoic acid--peptidoglycan teichoic acid transferase